MARYRTPVFSQDLFKGTLNNYSRPNPSPVFNDVTNKSFSCLCLSEETMTNTLRQGIEALLLQLSLSQTQTTAAQNPRSCEAYSRMDFEEPININDDENRVSRCNSARQFPKMDVSMSSRDVIIAKEPVSPAVSLITRSTELSLPPAPRSNSIRDKSRWSGGHGKNSGDKVHIVSRERKNLKSKITRGSDEDVQAAIGLTVATAETLVIADIMNGCLLCQSLGPNAILDAALVLRRERDALGLDDFMLGDQQGTTFADSKWEEDLDDTVLEVECYGTLQTDSMKKGPCMDTSRLADMQLSECTVKNEIAMKAVKAFEAITRSTTAQLHQGQSEGNSGEVNGVVQRTITCPLPELNDKTDEGVASHKFIQAQAVAPKDSFNSRWLGGWTGTNGAEGKQACCNGWQLEKRYKTGLTLETSELSESCDLPPPAKNLLKCSKDVQIKCTNLAVTSVAGSDAEALSTGSCAEILLALSQASVKCSFQEPLCSFVPCSVNVKTNPLSTEAPRCNDAEYTEDMASKQACYIANGKVSAGENESMGDEPHLTAERSPTRGTKRTHLESLRKHSTGASIFQGTLQPTENRCPMQVQDKREIPNDKRADNTVKAAGSYISPNNCVQCELVLEDSALQDSPPLIWHRGTRRRLRACRIAESDVTEGKTFASLTGSLPVVNRAVANCSQLENMNLEKCEKSKRTQKDEIQLLSGCNRLTTNCHSPNGKPGELEDQHYKMKGTGLSDIEALGNVNTKQKTFNRRQRRSTSTQLFKGLSFLITGFSASQKDTFEELCKKIQEHGGVIMSCIPSLSSLNGQKTLQRQHTTISHSIVIAPQKVRTLKYLYGCAAGLLIVRPNWLDEMITKQGLLFNLNSKETIKQIPVSVWSGKRRRDLIFSRIAAYIHGQRTYCLKLSSLIQHGAGKVVRSMNGLVQTNNLQESLIRVVVAEHQSKLSLVVRETAARSGVPIVSGDWIIDSLFNGRLLGLPAATEALNAVKVLTNSKASKGNKNLAAQKMLKIEGDVSFAKTICESAPAAYKEGSMMKPPVSVLGQVEVFPALSSMGLSFVLDIPKDSASEKLSRKIYYKSICMNETIYTAGDIVEVQPEAGEVNEPYVAQIESFYVGHSSSIKTRSGKNITKEKCENPCFLCCRWFYRPSDTGFSCVGNGKELYLSQHFDDNAPVHSIIKKVQMVLVVGEETFINDTENGWKKVVPTSCTVEGADYICRFFYDYHKESLHQLKVALIS